MSNSKVIIVVGGTGGVGSEICSKLYQKGHTVICVSRGVMKSLIDFNDKIIFKQCDVTSENQCMELAQNIVREYRRIDGIVYCAIGYHFGEPEDHNLNTLVDVFNGNVFGASNISNACLRYLKETKGRICYIGSIAGINVLPKRSAYCASKAALKMMMMCQSVDWAKHEIAVNMLTTSYVATELELAGAETEEWGHSYKDVIERTPMKRPAHPSEIADGVCWILLFAPKYMTGSDIIIDGGWSAWSGFGQI